MFHEVAKSDGASVIGTFGLKRISLHFIAKWMNRLAPENYDIERERSPSFIYFFQVLFISFTYVSISFLHGSKKQ
jgi:hypothetical protein